MTRFKVGLFSFLGLGMIIGVSIFVNHNPYWWRPCQLVKINVEDATGLKMKSPIRSLGIDIGYLYAVNLSEDHVTLEICITAPIELTPLTRAYIRGEGFLGDKFVELKPVRYQKHQSFLGFTSVWAEELESSLSEASSRDNEKRYPAAMSSESHHLEIPVGAEGQDVQKLVGKVETLVHQVSGIANNLKQVLNPEDLKQVLQQLNITLEHAAKTLSPQGNLNQVAQRTLAKLEDSIEQLRSLLTRVNRGEGSLGMLLNDPEYAQEMRLALKNLNRLLNRLQNLRWVIDLGGALLTQYQGGRAWFQLGLWPSPQRYYLLGLATDPRGKITNSLVTTSVGTQVQTIETQVVERTGVLLTLMLGRVFLNRFDLSLGALYGDGTASASLYLGPTGEEERIQLRQDIYIRNAAAPLDTRLSLNLMPFQSLYLRAGIESVRQYQGRYPFFFGVGLSFEDEDIKLLFALK